MSDLVPTRTSWALPILLAIATTVAGGFAFLYLTRPNTGELGSIRVVVTDDDGKGGNTIHVIVAEAPVVQKDTISPGNTYTGVVYYPAPYLTKPNLKLTCGKRNYDVVAETGLGFTWAARPLPDDFREDLKKLGALDNFLGESLTVQVATGRLKPGLVFEDFNWEAKGLRLPPSSLPPETFEQKGKFNTVHGQQGMVNFPIPYRQAPNVQIDVGGFNRTIITETTPTGFKWKNVGMDDNFNNTTLDWFAKGVR